MANDERIGVIIETELQGNATEQATAKLKEFEKTAAKTATAVDKSFAAMSKSQQRVSSSSQQLSRSAVNVNGALVSLNRTVQDAPFGFIAIQNNITELFQQFGNIRQQLGSTGAAFKALATSFIGPAGVLFAFNAATSLVTALIQRYGSLDNAVFAAVGGLDSAAEAQQKYNKALADSIAEARGELAMVQALVAVAKDETVSRQQRTAAIKEIQKEYPGYLKNINLENINSDAAAKALDRLTQSILRKAKAEAATKIITEQYAKILEEQNKNIFDQVSTWQKLGITIANAGNVVTSFGALAKKAGENQAEAVAEAEANIANFQKILNDILKEDALAETIGIGGKEKDIKTVSDIIAELNRELTTTDVIAQATGRAFDDLGKDKIQAFEKAIKSLIDIGIQPSNAIFREFQTRIEEIQRFIAKQQLPQAGNIIVTATPVFELGRPSTTTLRGLEDSFRPILDLFNTKAKEIFKTGFADAIEGAFAGLGEAIASGGNVIGNVLSGFINGISGMLAQLGRLLIAQGVALEAFKNSLRTLQGFQAIIAGGALILAAAAFRSFANKGIGSFATGGTAVGTQLAVVGDNSSRREHILSDMQLQKIAGSGNTQLELTTRLVGTDLWLLIQRVAKEQLRR